LTKDCLPVLLQYRDVQPGNTTPAVLYNVLHALKTVTPVIEVWITSPLGPPAGHGHATCACD
jgi:hypothetical protein